MRWSPAAVAIPSEEDMRSETVINLERSGYSEDISMKSLSARSSENRKKRKLDNQKSNEKQVQGKKAKLGTAIYMQKQLDCLINAVESYCRIDAPECSSTSECITLLRGLPGVEPCNEPFKLSSRLFLKHEYREMFLAIKNPDVKLYWLKEQLKLKGWACSIAECMTLLSSLPGVEPCDELYMLGTRLFMKREYKEMSDALKNSDVQLDWLKEELKKEAKATQKK
ncbi:hypothetical protein SLEP1_g30648 [Rubroshorea leprosula]|uniref:Uncharacterized protein n=1 Tax=Rubroshorea leprosula TaxID=152421 RepID=A0AAV5K374_9ROSI|nr:hypothetical protein SLEP1_g30648 [Rubroshorea leprosula]